MKYAGKIAYEAARHLVNHLPGSLTAAYRPQAFPTCTWRKVVNQANHIFGVKNLGKHKLGGLLVDFLGGDQIAAFHREWGSEAGGQWSYQRHVRDDGEGGSIQRQREEAGH